MEEMIYQKFFRLYRDKTFPLWMRLMAGTAGIFCRVVEPMIDFCEAKLEKIV